MIAEQADQKKVVAVIDIGTGAIRMVIAEVGLKGSIRHLENLQKPVRFGKDVFTTGRMSNQAMRQAVEIMKDFKSVMDGYGVQQIQAIATSAVREALNRDNFLDQVYIRTGIDVEVIEGPEQSRLGLIAVEYALKDRINLEKKNCLIVEVGSGSTEMILLNQGQVEVTRTVSLGSIRLPEQIVPGKTDLSVMQRILRRHVHEIVSYTAQEYNLNQVDTFIAFGGDVRFVAHHLVESSEESFAKLDKKSFINFVRRVAKLSPEDIVNEFGIAYGQAEVLCPALLIYMYFLNEIAAEDIIVPTVSIRDGLLLEQAQLLSGYKRTDVSKQVLNSARHLAEKYRYDKAHSSCVASLALKLFDALKEDHGMGGRERMLLEVASIVHDIGTYISPSAHNKHSSYLINASEMFGLRKSDKSIVSNVARYHRRSGPSQTHEPYMSLPKSGRVVVSKLAAILRVADALDHSHQQKIRQFSLERSPNAYTLWVDEQIEDVFIERESLQRKGDLFVDVFGLPIYLKQGAPPK